MEKREKNYAVIVELDYKGYYKRYALTLEEFREEFRERIVKGLPDPTEKYDDQCYGHNYTLRPMVHIWYAYVPVGESLWNRHFTDMEYGLPESDIESGNLAYVDFGEFKNQDLLSAAKKTINKGNPVTLAFYLKQCEEQRIPPRNHLRLFLSGDSKDFGFEDYNVRVSTWATLEWICSDTAHLILDEIDGEKNVRVAYQLSGSERILMPISRELVAKAYKRGVITLILSPHKDGIACGIGDNWFYFGGATAEEYSDVETYKKDVPEEDIISSITETLDAFLHDGEEFLDEYHYYQLCIMDAFRVV